MCNKLHPESYAIPEEGYAWKVFTVEKNFKRLRMLFSYERYTSINEYSTEWQWQEQNISGFCGFPNYPVNFLRHIYGGDRSLLLSTNNCAVIPIQIYYHKGLGGHRQDGITKGIYKIILFQAFEITKRYRDQGYHL